MSRRSRHDRASIRGKLSDNVLHETAGSTLLACGHSTTLQPVAIYPSRRKLYDCPFGCGLVKDRRGH